MIKQLFEDEPGQWGLRGDPYLWKELREYMASAKEPASEQEFEQLFEEAFLRLTGESLSPGKEIFIERYSFGGMSSGYVSSDFWLEEVLPMLRRRFRQLG